MGDRRFRRRLLLIVVLGIGLRLVYAVAIDDRPLSYDANWYHTVGSGLADGEGFSISCPLILSCEPHPTAYFPPLYPSVLAAGSAVGLDSPLAHRAVTIAVGAVGLGLVGLLGRRLAGPRVGLAATAIGALHPGLIANDGSLMAESLYLTLTAGALLALLAALAARDRRAAVTLGVVVGLAALTRSEGLALLAFAVWPAALVARRRGRSHAVSQAAVATVVALAVVAPWVGYASARFATFVPVSNNGTTVLRGANCDRTWHGEQVGSWSYECLDTLRPGAETMDEAEFGRVIQAEGIDYVRAHADDLPRVAAIRLARTWGLYDPMPQLTWEAAEGRTPKGQLAAWVFHLGVLGSALVGARSWRPRGESLVVLAAPVLMVSVTTLATYGNQRFRVAAEVPLLLLAGWAVASAAAWLAVRSRRRRDERSRPALTPTAPVTPQAGVRRHATSVVVAVLVCALVAAGAGRAPSRPSAELATGPGRAAAPSPDAPTYRPEPPRPLVLDVAMQNPTDFPQVVGYLRVGDEYRVVPLDTVDGELHRATWRVLAPGGRAAGVLQLASLPLPSSGPTDISVGVSFNDGRTYSRSHVYEVRLNVESTDTPDGRAVVAIGDPQGWRKVDFGGGPVWLPVDAAGVLWLE